MPIAGSFSFLFFILIKNGPAKTGPFISKLNIIRLLFSFNLPLCTSNSAIAKAKAVSKSEIEVVERNGLHD